MIEVMKSSIRSRAPRRQSFQGEKHGSGGPKRQDGVMPSDRGVKTAINRQPGRPEPYRLKLS